MCIRDSYEGTMQDAQSGIELGRYAPQEMTTIRITLRLPKETDNTYSIREAAVDVELTALTIQESVATGDQTQRTLLISSTLAVSYTHLDVYKRQRPVTGLFAQNHPYPSSKKYFHSLRWHCLLYTSRCV